MQHKSKKGFVLLLTLLVMAALSGIAGALVTSLSTDLRSLSVQSSKAKAFWYAEAGIADD